MGTDDLQWYFALAHDPQERDTTDYVFSALMATRAQAQMNHSSLQSIFRNIRLQRALARLIFVIFQYDSYGTSSRSEHIVPSRGLSVWRQLLLTHSRRIIQLSRLMDLFATSFNELRLGGPLLGSVITGVRSPERCMSSKAAY